MLTTLSLWGIYFASYLVDYAMILLIIIIKHILWNEGIHFWGRLDLLTCGFLVLFIVVSVIITNCIRNMKMNTRIKIVPEKNITNEMMGYILAQVVTLATTLFTDWWILINVVLFIVVGIIFVNSNAVHASLLFVVPLGNRIYQSGDDIIITNYSL